MVIYLLVRISTKWQINSSYD